MNQYPNETEAKKSDHPLCQSINSTLRQKIESTKKEGRSEDNKN